jgi:hypothetical protein
MIVFRNSIVLSSVSFKVDNDIMPNGTAHYRVFS